jgi:hypothetical protein
MQVIGLGLCARMYGIVHLREHDPWLERMQARVRLEHGLLLGGVCILAGVAIGGTVVAIWVGRGFGELGEEQLAIVGGTCIVVGVQIVFTSFLLSILGLRRPRAVRPEAHDLHAPHAVGTDARSLVDIRPGSAR